MIYMGASKNTFTPVIFCVIYTVEAEKRERDETTTETERLWYTIVPFPTASSCKHFHLLNHSSILSFGNASVFQHKSTVNLFGFE